MTVKAAETAAPFAEATCQALTALVLRLSGLAQQSAVPEDLVDGLRELAATDPGLAQWASAVSPHVAEVAKTFGELAPGAETLGEFRYDQLPLNSETLGEFRYGELRNSRNQGSEVQAHDDGWQPIAARLPELLIRHAPVGPAGASDAAWWQLQSVCHVVLRLRTLENRFVDELQRQKREAIYQFAYGLSHELNNPLANIATRGGVLAEQESHPQRKTLLEAIVANAMRGCEMLGDLMLVARPPQLNCQSARIDLLVSSVVDSALLWARNLDVDLKLDIQSKREMQLDTPALREALWALIRNAIEAMLDGGTIYVSVTDCGSAGVAIEISDQGSGLSRAALEHCFDPYYSGREAGRGLGLGLSKAQRIVTLHRGQLTLANRAGGGAVARVVLPSE